MSKLSDRDEAIAREVAWGVPVADVAKLHGVVPATVAAVVGREEVSETIASYRELYHLRGAALVGEMLLMSNRALDNIREVIESDDPSRDASRARLETSWRIVETLLPAKSQTLDVRAQVGVDETTVGVLRDLNQSLAALSAQRRPTIDLTRDPHFLDGGKGST